jgi:CO/xanthine dehydrogenase FAD-binding subunit
MLAEFDLWRPQTLPEALALLADKAPEAKPLAGGTNVLVELRDGAHRADGAHAPQALVDLSKVRELRGLQKQDGHVVIGGGTTLTELLTHPLIAEHGALLKEAAAVFANPLVRNRATVAGNLADASPAADTAPPLLALGAAVQLASRNGSRWVPLQDFLVGVRKTLRQPDELLVAVGWPVPTPQSASAYSKFGLRRADAISVLSAAVLVERDEAGHCRQARIALGAVAPRPFRAHTAEDRLKGQALTAETIAEAARLAAEAARPIDDIRGSAAYRRRIVEVTVRRLLTQAAGQAAR